MTSFYSSMKRALTFVTKIRFSKGVLILSFAKNDGLNPYVSFSFIDACGDVSCGLLLRVGLSARPRKSTPVSSFTFRKNATGSLKSKNQWSPLLTSMNNCPFKIEKSNRLLEFLWQQSDVLEVQFGAYFQRI